MRTLGSLLMLVLCAACDGGSGRASSGSTAAEIRVAAASDLSYAFEELGKSFEARERTKVTFTFGSTGQLAKQIAEGAPYDVFAAANVSFVDEVVKAEACDGTTKAPYGRGRVAVWVRDGLVAPPEKLEDLSDPRFVHLALANPEHAPYGRAAKQALEKAGLWAGLEPRMVYGKDVRNTLQLAESGNAEAAFVAYSLSIMSKGGHALLLDDALYDPIDQALVVCKRGKDFELGKRFAAFVNGAEGREVMKRYGFVLPGETVADKK